MSPVEVKFIGSGDAFGSGGRLQCCLLVKGGEPGFLIDCGASSMIGLNRAGEDPERIGLILASNLHGDHLGGVPYFIIDAQLNRKRKAELIIAGPPGLKERLPLIMDACFPGASTDRLRFLLRLVELAPGRELSIDGITVASFSVPSREGDPHLALRVACGGKVIAYSGDTEWDEVLVAAAGGADLFVAESYFFEKQVRFHMDYRTLIRRTRGMGIKRIVLTHMSEEMLASLDRVECEYAEDGKTLII